jgi:hypothetical protein
MVTIIKFNYLVPNCFIFKVIPLAIEYYLDQILVFAKAGFMIMEIIFVQLVIIHA